MTHDSGFNPATPEHPFAGYVRILGKGKTGTRSLTQAEARTAFGMILRGEIEPVQLGAFLMLLRVKEESGEELAGFVQACRDYSQAPAGLHCDLDWSSYAGKKHQHPWYLLSCLLLAQAGYRIFLHGSDGHTDGRLYTEQAMLQLGLPVAGNWQQVSEQLDAGGLSYLPLRAFCEPLHDMMQLKPILGLRSPVNTLARMYNPLSADCSIQSVFHPAYGDLHQQADALLQQPRAMVFKGDSGEVEIKPQADSKLLLWTGSASQTLTMPRSIPHRVGPVPRPESDALRALWCSENADSEDEYGLRATLATTSAALLLLQKDISLAAADKQALQLWRERDTRRLLPCP